MQISEKLKEEIYRTVKDVKASYIGIAFSGGLDSSLLAKTCKDIGKNIILLTVGFSNRKDIENSIKISKIMDLPLVHQIVTLEELEDGLREVLSSIEFDRTVRLENCLCFYYVFRMASKYNIQNVLSANGADELFCGYHRYTREFNSNQNNLMNLMTKLITTAKKDKEQIDKISDLFDVNYDCPFLSGNFIEFAMKIPINLKIESNEDDVRKHILRKVALEVGVPRSAALRRKKAFQYSSGMHKALQRLAKKSGYSKNNARQVGYKSPLRLYLEEIKDS
jgi:asparagine synthase (glutamine-hydrolysing)